MRAVKLMRTEAILKSIAKHGLVPSRVAKESLGIEGSMPVMGEGSLCINYVNAEAASEVELAYATAKLSYEEYTGIAGIAIERLWPLTTDTSSLELQERLRSVVVFVLEPPKGLHKKTGVFGSKAESVEIGHYTKEDGFSQMHGALLTSKTEVYSGRVVEIKTMHHFKPSEIKVILIPRDLKELAIRAFPDLKDKIVVVPQKKLVIKSIGAMLLQCHGEEQDPSYATEVDFPDFERAIRELCRYPEYKRFSIHATRLPTEYDLVLRIIASVEKSADLIKRAGGTIVELNADGSAWVAFSKSEMHSLEKLKPLIMRVAARKDLESPLLKLMAASAHFPDKAIMTEEYLAKHELLRTSIIAAKAEFKLVSITRDLSDKQVAAIKKEHMHIFKLEDGSYLVAHLAAKKDTLTKIVTSWPDYQKARAATKIQASYRGFKRRNFYSEYQKANARSAALKAELAVAEVALEAAKVRLLSK